MKIKKEILTVCYDCGKKYGTKDKGIFGSWIGTCDICHKKKVGVASAPHDFGIYSSDKIIIDDLYQDLIWQPKIRLSGLYTDVFLDLLLVI